jgi:hypothetical protein
VKSGATMRAPVRRRPLSQAEYHELKRMARSRKLCAGRVQRAQIVLPSNQGYLSHEIAQLGVHEKTVRQRVGHSNRCGIPGLEEGPRHGRPPVYSPHHVGEVIATALTRPDTLELPFGSRTLDRLVPYLTDLKGIPMKRG